MGFSQEEYWRGSISSPRRSSRPRDQTHISWFPALAGGFLTTTLIWAAQEMCKWTLSQLVQAKNKNTWKKVSKSLYWFSSVQSLSCVLLFATPWNAARQASLSITNSWSLLKLMSITLVMPSNHLILYRPLLLPPSIFPGIRIFSKESVLHIMWPKYWSFSFSPSSEYSGLISFRMDWLDLLKHLLQHHNSKASIVQHSALFIAQLSYPYMTIGKKHSFN